METRGSRSKRSKHRKLANKQWIVAASTIVIGTGIAMANTSVVRADAAGVNGEKSTQTEVKQETAVTSAPVTVIGDNTASDQKAEKSNTDTKEEKDLSSEKASEKTAVGDAADSDAEKVVAESEKTTNMVSTTETVKPLAAKAHANTKEDDAAAKSAAEKVLADAKKDAGKIVEDKSNHYTGYVNGHTPESQIMGAATISLSSNTINENNSFARLTLKGTAKIGETYTILIPTLYADRQRNISSLPPELGETTVSPYKGYVEVVYKFTKDASFNQAITLIRNEGLALSDVFADEDTYLPYSMISGQIKVIHGTQLSSFNMNYQLPKLFTGGTDNTFLDYVSDGKVANGSDINLSIPLDLGYSDHKNDMFGTSSIDVPDFSFYINGPENVPEDQNIADWITLKSDEGMLSYANGNRSSYKITLESQAKNVIKVNVKDIQALTVNRRNANSKWTGKISLHVQVPKEAFTKQTSAYRFEISGKTGVNAQIDIPMSHDNAQFTSHDKGLSFDVLEASDDLNSQITHKFYKTYQNIDSGQYTTLEGNYMPDKQGNGPEVIEGQRYESGYIVDALHNSSNKSLNDVRYELDIPQGIDVYSINYDTANLPDYI